MGGRSPHKEERLTAALAGAALGAATAGPGTDDLVAAAIGAGGVHVHVADGSTDPFSMRAMAVDQWMTI